MGRPKGSKNKQNHKAGGARKNTGPKKRVHSQTNNVLQYFNSNGPTRTNAENEEVQADITLQGEEEAVADGQIESQTETSPSAEGEASASTTDDNDAAADSSAILEDTEDRKRAAYEALKKMAKSYSSKHSYNGDSDDDSSDSEDDVEGEQRNSQSKWKYMPSKKSPLYDYLMERKSHLIKQIDNNNYQQWYCPPVDPLMSSSNRIENWYLANAWCFSWVPLQQYKYCGLGSGMKFTCKKCGSNGKFESKGYRWRPAFHLDKIVWVLHRRFQFYDCKHCISSIDIEFLNQLPVKVKERFPYVFGNSIGCHESLIQLLISLSTKSVLFGSFSKGVNEVYSISYSKSMINYLDHMHEVIENKKIYFPNAEFIPDVFSSYLDKDNYSGLYLKEALLKRLFLMYVQKKEGYMQSSFQLNHDHGYAGDHTHKYSKQIASTNRADKIFTASYTIVGMLGKVVSSRLTFTKSNDELNPILSGLSGIRGSMGLPSVKRYETDNAAGDGGLWTKHFPELKNNVVPPILPDQSLGYATIKNEDFLYITSSISLSNWCMSIITDVNHSVITCVGIDCEWNYKDGTHNITRLLQLSFPNQKVAVIHLSKIGILNKDSFPAILKNLLENPSFLYCGRNVSIDCSRIEELGVSLSNRFELRNAALYDDPEMDGTSLEKLAAKYLGLNVNKSCRIEDFSIYPLPMHLQQYSALDALVSRKLGEFLRHKNESNDNDLVPAMLQLQIGDKVSYKIGRKVAATGELTFVGGNGYQTRYGNTTVGSGKALLHINTIKIPNAKPLISTNVYNRSMTLSHIKNNLDPPIIVVATSSLEKKIDVHQMSQMNTLPTNSMQIDIDSLLEETMSDIQQSHQININQHVLNSLPPPDSINPVDVQQADIDEDSDDDDQIRSRIKEDIFHRFQDLPLKRGCPIKPAIMNLMINATFKKHKEDYKAVTEILRRKGVQNFEEHFYHNKEYWRERVRMFCPPCVAHARQMSLIHAFFASNEATKPFYTEEVKEYFEEFERKCRLGYFQELEDVSTYKWNGRDSDGLSLWLRLRGSNRCENYHQKMECAIGSWIVGPMLAHCILLILTYRYNANANVARCNGIDFHHYELDLIDRIQIRMQQLHNVIVFDNHVNSSLMQTDPTFISVGIGPLHYSSDFVAKGTPSDELKSDLRFIAEKMNVICPPLPIAHRDEKRIFNDFYKNNPTSTDTTRKQLAKIFLQKANYQTIFPKLPSMLKAHEKKWKKNSLIKLATDQMRENYEQLLSVLSEPIDHSGVANESNNMSVLDNIRDKSRSTLKSNFPTAPSNDSANIQTANEITIDTSHQGTSLTSASRSVANRKCSNFPYCQSLASICKGFKPSTCIFLKTNQIELPDNNALAKERKIRKREKDRLRMKQRRNQDSST